MSDVVKITDISLNDEADHSDSFPKDRGVYFNTGFTLLASTHEHDILLWTCVYKMRNMGAVYNDEGRQLTTLTILPKNRSIKSIFDNNFVRSGWHPNKALKASDVQVIRGNDKVVYKVEGRTYSHRPPVWEVKGIHAGVELDLTYRQLFQRHWILGESYEKMQEIGAAMYDVLCSVNGTIRVDGKAYEIINGFGVHEHGLLTRPQWDLYAQYEAPHEHTWVNFRSEDLGLWFFQWTKKSMEGGRLWVGGKDIAFKPNEGKGSTSFKVLEHWNDPRSGLHIPCKWHLLLSSPEGTLEMTMTAQGRHYYHPPLYNGELMWMWFLCIGNGTFKSKDGHIRDIKDTLVCIEWGRSILAAEETMSGPVI